MRFIVFQGGLGNQMFQYGYYKMMLSRFPKLSYQFAYGNSHNGFELDKVVQCRYEKSFPILEIVI